MQKRYDSYLEFLKSARVRQAMNFGAFPQRFLWASAGTKDPTISDTLYIEHLAAPYTVNTMPENTLMAYADHGKTVPLMTESSSNADLILQQFSNAGIDYHKLGDQLQQEDAESFNKSWEHLIDSIQTKRNLK